MLELCLELIKTNFYKSLNVSPVGYLLFSIIIGFLIQNTSGIYCWNRCIVESSISQWKPTV